MPRGVRKQPVRCQLDRKQLLAALTRLSKVIVSRQPKPILTGVRLRAGHGQLQLAGTDLETSLVTTVNCEGALRTCVVACDELARRLKAAKSPECTLRLDGVGGGLHLMVNGGAVEHALPTFDPKEYPLVREIPDGGHFLCAPAEFKAGLGTALLATAHEPSRYAIEGLLLESDKAGTRLVATDGRRMVVCELPEVEGPFRGTAILPRQLATVAQKLIEPKVDANVVIRIKPNPPTKDAKGQEQPEPADVYIGGPRWLLWSREPEGTFPRYRDVIPASQSRFAIDRRRFIELIQEVSLATDLCNRGITIDLSADRVTVSAGSGEIGTASGSVPAEFIGGGGDNHIVTGFNPSFLLDALRSIPDDRVIIDVGQNKCSPGSDTVSGCPALVYGEGSQATRWVLMPINAGLPPSKETLGSDYVPDEEEEAAQSTVAAA